MYTSGGIKIFFQVRQIGAQNLLGWASSHNNGTIKGAGEQLRSLHHFLLIPHL